MGFNHTYVKKRPRFLLCLGLTLYLAPSFLPSVFFWLLFIRTCTCSLSRVRLLFFFYALNSIIDRLIFHSGLTGHEKSHAILCIRLVLQLCTVHVSSQALECFDSPRILDVVSSSISPRVSVQALGLEECNLTLVVVPASRLAIYAVIRPSSVVMTV